jgi:DNA primase
MTLEYIKRISIRDYLGSRGIKPQSERAGRAMYISPLREERTASFSVNYRENVWYDHGIGAGGSIIDLVARMEGCSIGEAIRRLENEALGSGSTGICVGSLSFSSHRDTPVSARQTEPEKPRIEIVSVEELRHPALVEYLTNRGVDPAAARKYCNEIRYRIGDREYFAIGFRNDAGGWELRNRNFKGSSTPKNITTISNDSDTVMVFEGFIDFLSYLSLKQNPSPTIDTTVLNSVANLQRAIPFLESHRTIHAFLDNDEAGRKALDSLRESLPASKVVDQSPFYRSYKDLNDYWREQAADIIKRPAPDEKTNAAVQVRREAPVTPVREKGRRL